MESKEQPDHPVVITIAGSDSGGGAGIQADIKAITATGGFAASAITCLTAQNPDSVSAVEALPAEFIRQQLEQVVSFFDVSAIKTGMLFNREIIDTVSHFIESHPTIQTVIDPVMVATSGAVLLQPDAIHSISKKLLPKGTLITPNLDEAGLLLGKEIKTLSDAEDAAKELQKKYTTNVLLKGGHLEGSFLQDILVDLQGESSIFESKRIESINTHGSGCTLSSAIATYLAQGLPVVNAIGEALIYLRQTMQRPIFLNGIPYINHTP